MDPLVTRVVDDCLSLVDTRLPGLVEGLYLVGSVALHDFQPHTSDIDFVAVTTTPPDLAGLAEVHATLARRHRRPHFDGRYLASSQLAVESTRAGGVEAHEGRVHTRASGPDPVTWHTLATHGIAARGPARERLTVWTDPDELRQWSRRNVDEYWVGWLRRSERLLSPAGLACVHPWGPPWGVLGISRIHATIATGEVVSKTAAGVHARQTFGPRWTPITDECLRLRRGSPVPAGYRNPLARRRDALDFVRMVIDEGFVRYLS